VFALRVLLVRRQFHQLKFTFGYEMSPEKQLILTENASGEFHVTKIQ
jgi:hypothetical protein